MFKIIGSDGNVIFGHFDLGKSGHEVIKIRMSELLSDQARDNWPLLEQKYRVETRIYISGVQNKLFEK